MIPPDPSDRRHQFVCVLTLRISPWARMCVNMALLAKLHVGHSFIHKNAKPHPVAAGNCLVKSAHVWREKPKPMAGEAKGQGRFQWVFF